MIVHPNRSLGETSAPPPLQWYPPSRSLGLIHTTLGSGLSLSRLRAVRQDEWDSLIKRIDLKRARRSLYFPFGSGLACAQTKRGAGYVVQADISILVRTALLSCFYEYASQCQYRYIRTPSVSLRPWYGLVALLPKVCGHSTMYAGG